MRRGAIALGLGMLVGVCGCGEPVGGPPPSAADVKPALETYLVAHQRQYCSASVTLDQLAVTRVGAFDRAMGGWPVYAKFAATCHKPGNTVTWHDSGKGDVSAAFVRRSRFGAWEAYQPEILRQGEAMMNQQMGEMLKKMQVH